VGGTRRYLARGATGYSTDTRTDAGTDTRTDTGADTGADTGTSRPTGTDDDTKLQPGAVVEPGRREATLGTVA
jgi:hypothetical protein